MEQEIFKDSCDLFQRSTEIKRMNDLLARRFPLCHNNSLDTLRWDSLATNETGIQSDP